MEFSNEPSKYYSLRTDICCSFKDKNDESVILKVKSYSKSRRLVIQLSLISAPEKRHFFKLIHKNHKSENESQITWNIKPNETEVKLDFLTFKKAKKEEAIQFIKEYLRETESIDQIYKQNCSAALLQFLLYDGDKILEKLDFEIHNGNPREQELTIISCTPKILYDNGGITFYLKNKIKDDNNLPTLEVDILPRNIKNASLIAKTVLEYNIPLHEVKSNEFNARLCFGENKSKWMHFTKRENLTESLKRKSGHSIDSDIDCKYTKYSDDCLLSNGTFKSSSISKQLINDRVTTRLLRQIARVGHSYAFGVDLNDRMQEIMKGCPLVTILQDDVGDTPLNNAILKDFEDRADYLLEIIYKNFPSEINQTNTSGHTALILCPACDISLQFIKKLIDYGADIMKRDCEGCNALNVAIRYQKIGVLELLIKEAKSQNHLNEMNFDMKDLINDVLRQRYFDGLKLIKDLFPDINLNDFCINNQYQYIWEQFQSNYDNYELFKTPQEECMDFINDLILSDLNSYDEDDLENLICDFEREH